MAWIQVSEQEDPDVRVGALGDLDGNSGLEPGGLYVELGRWRFRGDESSLLEPGVRSKPNKAAGS